MIDTNPLQAMRELIDQGLQPNRKEFPLPQTKTPIPVHGMAINTKNLATNNEYEACPGMDIIIIIANEYLLSKYDSVRHLCAYALAAVLLLLAHDDTVIGNVGNDQAIASGAPWDGIHALAKQVGQADTPEAKARQAKLTCTALLEKLKG
jgi:hypothetical protein